MYVGDARADSCGSMTELLWEKRFVKRSRRRGIWKVLFLKMTLRYRWASKRKIFERPFFTHSQSPARSWLWSKKCESNWDVRVTLINDRGSAIKGENFLTFLTLSFSIHPNPRGKTSQVSSDGSEGRGNRWPCWYTQDREKTGGKFKTINFCFSRRQIPENRKKVELWNNLFLLHLFSPLDDCECLKTKREFFFSLSFWPPKTPSFSEWNESKEVENCFFPSVCLSCRSHPRLQREMLLLGLGLKTSCKRGAIISFSLFVDVGRATQSCSIRRGWRRKNEQQRSPSNDIAWIFTLMTLLNVCSGCVQRTPLGLIMRLSLEIRVPCPLRLLRRR